MARLDQRHRHVERGEDRGVFDADDAAADHRQRARQVLELQHLVAVEDDACLSNGTLCGRCGRVPTEISASAKPTSLSVAILVGEAQPVGVDEFRRRAHAAHAVAHELVLQHLDLVVERLVQPLDQVADRDVLLDPVAAPVEAALAPARQVEHRLAQRLRRDRAGMHRDAAEPPALVDHQHGLAELGRLDGGAPAGRPAADDDHVVVIHLVPAPAPRCCSAHD